MACRCSRELRKESSEAERISLLLESATRRDGRGGKGTDGVTNEDPAKLSLSNFLAGESNDPLQAPATFTNWIRLGAWAVELYEPELLATADARTLINYRGEPQPVINLCSYNYLGLANHPDVLAAAREALSTHGLGACGSPMLSGMTDLHRELVIVEGIYSMDGDFGNLRELIAVAESHDASVFIDEAHSMLACGEHGRGAAEKFGIEERVPLVYGTFSKAFGALGGFVAGSKETLQYLRFYAHPYVYSCALPPVVIAAILKALELGTSQPGLRAKLWENADYFHAQLRKLGFDTGASTTYVMPIVIGDRGLMYRLGHELRRCGLWVAAVDYPAVPQNRICFRACVTAKHTRADLDEALNILEDTLVPALLQKQSA